MYDRIKKFWNEVFIKEKPKTIDDPLTGYQELDEALDWLCEDSKSILDFGCGNGVFLFKCGLRGTSKHLGIDLSEEAIKNAQSRTKSDEFKFISGGIEALAEINDKFDGVILSNIIDNLIPEDIDRLLQEIKRIVKSKGKIFIKVNPYLQEEEIKKYNIKVINGNLLDDGLYLYNLTTREWKHLLAKYFTIKEYKEVYYPQHEQTNRIFLLEN